MVMITRRRIEVVDYDPNWITRFEREADGLRNVIGTALSDIHHVGSTSVPGLRAKPTIDILVEVVRGTDIPRFDPLMEALGCICRGECLDATVPGTPGRYYYVRKDGVVHLVHVHICAVGHFEIAEMLSLRNYLRSHPEEAERYGDLKSRLAREFTYDNVGYMRSKDALVKEMVETSLRWWRTPDASRSK